jgi:hypothetical protein
MSAYRYTRQIRLAEVGDDGQERIMATTAIVDAEGLGGAVEARYLAAAGVRKIATLHDEIGDAARAVDSKVSVMSGVRVRLGHGEPPAFGVRDPAAREIVLGAWRALAHLRRAVKRDGTP